MSSIHPDIHFLLQSETPEFANDRMEHFDKREVLDLPFTQMIGSVDLAQVVGTLHPDYAGHTWIELLPTRPDRTQTISNNGRSQYQGLMKRGHRCIERLWTNPGYYTSHEGKEYWSFSKLGDRYYVNQGNHRTVVGRFFLSLNKQSTVIHGVGITEFHLPPSQIEEKPEIQQKNVSQPWWNKWKTFF
ncbi:hypothetical protein [Undibacterium luofuense]|uniref:Uncharacterized protein n=1 Tax=Undibacterium luofuense TaxID=2828733 RepID=A0A941DMF8_9BURK|nr:hypothetical protein [Undibacterium luofuense]MBR7782329.1 hypothetical protein [Undibacterium luofuense]